MVCCIECCFECLTVDPGYYRFEATTQVECPPGKFGAGGSAECADCDKGKYQDTAGRTSCLTCQSGKIAPQGSVVCVLPTENADIQSIKTVTIQRELNTTNTEKAD